MLFQYGHAMDLLSTIAKAPFILAEAAVIERLRRETDLPLDPHILHAGWIYPPPGRRALARIQNQYMDVGRRHDLPLLLAAPTWRANPERIQRAGLAEGLRVNGDAVNLLKDFRRCKRAYSNKVFIGGLLACRGDAYRPEESLTAAEAARFHRAQTEALAAARPDYLMAATLPALAEAEGLAAALSQSGLPYLISFVVRGQGVLLDGTPLPEAVDRIDRAVSPPPCGYLVNCVHADVLAEGLQAADAQGAWKVLSGRLLGIQANTSRLSPEALDGRGELDTEAPGDFAAALITLHRRYGLKILGGCCGSDHRHLEAVAQAYNGSLLSPLRQTG